MLSSIHPHPALYQSWNLLAQGMRNNGIRATVATQNFVNKDSTAEVPGGDPYRREVPKFKIITCPRTGVRTPHFTGIQKDTAPFRKIYEPAHPAADNKGFVKMPNVNGYLESADVQSAHTGFHASARLYEMVTAMIGRTHDLMKNV